jgi:hypothetical protein
MPNYFKSKIYNTDKPTGDTPAYTFLNMKNQFDLKDAINQVKAKAPENIFILINGQQTLQSGTNDSIDECFGRALCGIDRTGKKARKNDGGTGNWDGGYKIYNSDNREDYQSLASAIYDDYGHRDLIIDVVNAKFNWGQGLAKNSTVFNNFCNEMQQVFEEIDTQSVRFFIAGFSRGGMFSLRLAKWLKDKHIGKEVVVATIDPVIKVGERKDWVETWADWKVGNKWKLGKLHPGTSKYRFPVLKSYGDIHYNVFERDGLGLGKLIASLIGMGIFGPFTTPMFTYASENMLASYFIENLKTAKDYPVGSAVSGASAPGYNYTGKRSKSKDRKYKTLPKGLPYDQFDISTDLHTAMPSKYKDWMISIVRKHFPSFDLNKSSGFAGSKVMVSFKYPPSNMNTVKVSVQNIGISLNTADGNDLQASFVLPESLEEGPVKILFAVDGSEIEKSFTISAFECELNVKSAYPGCEINAIFTPEPDDKANTAIVINNQQMELNWNGPTSTFCLPDDIAPGTINMVITFFNGTYQKESFTVLCPSVQLLSPLGNPESKLELFFRPTPLNISGIEMQWNGKDITLQNSNLNGPTLSFPVPKKTPAGIADILIRYMNQEISNDFMVTPYIDRCDSLYVLPYMSIKVYGHFHDNDSIQIDKNKLDTSFTDRFLSANVPLIDPGVKKLCVISDGKYKSNETEIIVCEPLYMSPVIEPSRVLQLSGKLQINLIGQFLEKEDKIILDGSVVRCKKQTNEAGSELEITPPFSLLPGIHDIQILRKTRAKYFLSNTFSIIVCDCIGNKNTMEVHEPNCWHTNKIDTKHRVLLNSKVDQPLKNGYDNCYWCLGDSNR